MPEMTGEQVALPTRDEYDEAVRLVGDGFGEVEEIVWRLEQIVKGRGRVPTFEDIGVLWSFVDQVRMYGEQLVAHAQAAADLMPTLDARRADAEKAAAKEAVDA